SAVSQAAGAGDLVRRSGDGVWRGALALGSAVARGRATAGQEQGCDAAGGVESMRVIQSIVLALTLLGTSHAFAVQPDEVMSDPTLEARARALSKELRCMVCQNQSIDDSDAPLAHDL